MEHTVDERMIAKPSIDIYTAAIAVVRAGVREICFIVVDRARRDCNRARLDPDTSSAILLTDNKPPGDVEPDQLHDARRPRVDVHHAAIGP